MNTDSERLRTGFVTGTGHGKTLKNGPINCPSKRTLHLLHSNGFNGWRHDIQQNDTMQKAEKLGQENYELLTVNCEK